MFGSSLEENDLNELRVLYEKEIVSDHLIMGAAAEFISRPIFRLVSKSLHGAFRARSDCAGQSLRPMKTDVTST